MIDIDDKEAARHLENLDRIGGVNSIGPPERPNLGTVQRVDLNPAGESSWKILSPEGVPSLGLFYPAGTQIMIRSAKAKEIRHWSTIDEHDPIDVRDKINFILNSCVKLTNSGGPPLTLNDILEVDKYHILFRIHELTFPNQENKLMAKIRCSNEACKHINSTQVKSSNLIGFSIPEEVSRWYSPEERCFVIKSERLGETIRVYMPTVGISEQIRRRRAQEVDSGLTPDDPFYTHAPYLVKDWKRFAIDEQSFTNLKMDHLNWGDAKFVAVDSFIRQLIKASKNRAVSVCDRCKTVTESHVFLGGSFTVKDILIVPARLEELF